MTITVLTPYSKHHTDRKLFKDGKVKKIKRNPKQYILEKEIARVVGECELKKLYNTLQEQEEKNADWIILFERTLEDKRDAKTIQANSEYLENDILRYVIQFDVDMELKGTNCNSLNIYERYELFKQHFPYMDGVKCVLHLSNKAGYTKHYPDHLSLRVYVELDEREGNKNLTYYLKPYHGVIDAEIYTNRRKHFTQRPEHEGDNPPLEFTERLAFIDGDKFSIRKMQAKDEYKHRKAESEKITKVHKEIGNRLDNDTSLKGIEELEELIKAGYFEENNRHSIHHSMIAKAIWKGQNGGKVIELIESDPRILGSKTREILESQAEAIHKKNKEYFDEDITLKDFDYREDLDCKDLKNADLSSLKEKIGEYITRGIPLILICKSPHGSGKTLALIASIMDILEEKLNRPPTLLYCSGTRTVIKSTTKKLQQNIDGVACYLEDDGTTINHEAIQREPRLGLGLNSLHHHQNKQGDCFVCDESEEAAMWAEWKETSYFNQLIETMKNHKICLLMDADASSMTYSLATRAQNVAETHLALINNKGAFIQGTTANLLKKENNAYELMIEEIEQDNLIYAHVDFAGKTLQKVTNGINKTCKGKKAVGFCSKKGCTILETDDVSMAGLNGLARLQAEPEETIDYLVSQGYQLIMTSPCIQKGWRCNSLINRFDCTIGVYTMNIITAPTIVQRTQRFVGVTRHYIYIRPSSSYVDAERYENELGEELENSIYGGIEATIDNPFRHNKELEKEATIIKQKHLANPKLHFGYVWESFGGIINYLAQSEIKPNKMLRGHLQDAKKQLLIDQAIGLAEDEDSLNQFKRHFKTLYGDRLAKPILNTEEIIELIKILERFEFHREDAIKFVEVLHSDKEKCKEWDMFGKGYKEILEGLSEERKLQRSLLNDEGFYLKAFYLMSRINEDIFGEGDITLKNIFSIGKKKIIALDVKDISQTEYHKLYQRYKNLFTGAFKSITGVKQTTPFLKALLKNVFHCSVKYGDAKPKKVVEAKEELILHYMEEGYIKKTKKAFPNKNEKPCIEILRKKIMDDKELGKVEKNYLRCSGKILVIELPDIIPNALYELYPKATIDINTWNAISENNKERIEEAI